MKLVVIVIAAAAAIIAVAAAAVVKKGCGITMIGQIPTSSDWVALLIFHQWRQRLLSAHHSSHWSRKNKFGKTSRNGKLQIEEDFEMNK